jgi:enamine deaminase RidA (YjgF/YER057c/UK114 family)
MTNSSIVASLHLRIGSIEEQTDQTLRTVEFVLIAAGSGLQNGIAATVYIANIDL